MLKKTLLLVAAVAALAALVAPTTAQASARTWLHNGAGLSGNVGVNVHGTLAFTSEQGGISCPASGSITLEPGSTARFIGLAFITKSCTYSGALDTLCGTVDHHTYTGLAWVLHATKFSNGSYGTRMTGIVIHWGGTGIFCPDVTVSGEGTATTDPHGLSTLELEGTLSSNITSEVTLSGTLAVTPSGTYSIAT